ncbi:MAG: type I restriction-modification system subunit M [Prevotellaceae bacterium]|jgi:type I restriction enzyme M protein|nr:type I restriction-modification system subunit M [Prevotellaceae bacterium]
MAIKKSQLYSALWESCNALRGSMDASQYKDYVLIVLFVKYLSDKAGQPGFRLKVPEGCSFKDFVSLKGDDHIGEKMNTKLEAIKEMNARQIGDLALPNFNDPTKLGSGRTMVDTLSKLIGVFENDALDFSHNRAADDDLLGDAYEYLMKNFAAESGKSKGQFYTPAEVSRVMAKLLRINELDRAEHTIYDPTCGSGSLLLRALAEASNPRVSIFGQEKDSSTAALAKLNMLLHGISSADIKVGDTLADPQFKQYGMVSTFDVCVANPPFSMKNWLASGMENDQYNRWTANLLPPAKCGDYAFLLHLIASMKPDEGRGACILPHGVLFRGNAEYDIRKHIVKQHYIKGIIGLPPNIFFGTGIPASIIIIDKKDKNSRKGIFFIDAKDGFKKDGAKNRLREQDIKRIVDAWDAQEPIDHYCRLVEWDEIERNDYNLNIPRYIQPKDTEIQHDIEAHLHGGLPAHDVDEMKEYWEACPSLKVSLFNREANGYFGLKPAKEDIAHSIENDPSYVSQSERFSALLNEWKTEITPQMKAVCQGARPKELIADWSASLLDKALVNSGLVDAYELYDVLLNYWADVMQDDCYMIANDGWTYPEVKATKPGKGDKKKAIMYDEIVCDLLPVNILLAEYFKAQTDEIADLSAQIEQKQSDMDALVEQNEEAFTFDDETEDGKELSVKPSDVKKAIKNAKIDGTSAEDLKLLQQWLDLSNEKDALGKTQKTKRIELTDAVVAKYAALTEDEIKSLVVERKWLASIVDGCEALMQNVTHQIASDVTTLSERYETTLGATETQVKDLEQQVLQSLKEMGFTL